MLEFVQQASRMWPDLGESRLSESRGFEEIDPDCPFWKNGHTRFVGVLRRHFNLINTKAVEDSVRRSLLADLGLVLQWSGERQVYSRLHYC